MILVLPILGAKDLEPRNVAGLNLNHKWSARDSHNSKGSARIIPV